MTDEIETYWSCLTTDRQGKEVVDDYQFDTTEEAETFLNEAFAQDCEEAGEARRNGETEEKDLTLVRYNADTLEVLERKEIKLSWEYYHGDFKEHSTWNRAGTGCW